MKIIIWAYPARLINIQLINSTEQPIDDVPIEEAYVYTNDIIPTIRNMIQLRKVDEAFVIGPRSFTEHIKEKIENQIPELVVYLGDNDD